MVHCLEAHVTVPTLDVKMLTRGWKVTVSQRERGFPCEDFEITASFFTSEKFILHKERDHLQTQRSSFSQGKWGIFTCLPVTCGLSHLTYFCRYLPILCGNGTIMLSVALIKRSVVQPSAKNLCFFPTGHWKRAGYVKPGLFRLWLLWGTLVSFLCWVWLIRFRPVFAFSVVVAGGGVLCAFQTLLLILTWTIKSKDFRCFKI